MFQPETKQKKQGVVRTIAASTMLAAALAGCSDIYYARRDTIALSAGDAIAANGAEQTVDPWPPHSGNTNIAFNGQKMQLAIERYRLDKVTQPIDSTSLQGGSQAPAQTQNITVSNPGGANGGSSGNSGQ